jgi:hypothetical protein
MADHDHEDLIRGLFAKLTGQFEDLSMLAVEGQGRRTHKEWQNVSIQLSEGMQGASDTTTAILVLISGTANP